MGAAGEPFWEIFSRSYPAAWALPLAFLANGLLFLLVATGLRRGRFSAGGVAVGWAMFLMVAVFVTLVSILIWRVGTLWGTRPV